MSIYPLLVFMLCIGTTQCIFDFLTSFWSSEDNEPEEIIKSPPETKMNIEKIIRYHGYPVEIHDVTTPDGYILSLQRIPQRTNNRNNVTTKKTPVFLQHGLLDSAGTWVYNGPGKSLAYILSDAGYDVWMGNSRGSTNSRRHIKYRTNTKEYWDFSFHELAKYDLPTSIDYVTKKTNQSQVYYIGHSQGTLIGFLEFARNPELSKKIKQFVALAPVASVNHVQGVFAVLSKVSFTVEYLLKILGVKEFMPSSWITKLFANFICTLPLGNMKCAGLIFLFAGFNTQNLDLGKVPIYIAHTPAGTSVKNVVHFAQLKRSGRLQQYDYGIFKNFRKYGQTKPPLYDISTMTVPVALFTATNDWLAPPADVNKNIRQVLPNITYDQNLRNYNHLDFVWGKNAHVKIYANILKLLS